MSKPAEAWVWFYEGRPLCDDWFATEAEARGDGRQYAERPGGDYLVRMVEADKVFTEAEARKAMEAAYEHGTAARLHLTVNTFRADLPNILARIRKERGQ